MKKRKLAAWIVLTIIAVVAAFCLALTNEVTEDVIAQQAIADAEAARKTLVPDADAFEALEAEGVDSLYRGTKDGEAVGYVAQVTVTGFGGPVEITVGTQADAPELTGIKVGGSSFSETAGLGAKSKEPKFMNQFAGKMAPVMLNDGEENDTDAQEVDAITAATITSKAVVRGVNQAVEAIAPYAGFELDSGNGGAVALGDGRFAATAAGFGGDVYVEITLDDTNTITDIVVGDDKFAETPGLGGKAQDDEFKSQFIGKTGQLVLGQDIDAIAGATITSNAVVNAVNTAMAAATGEEVVAAPAVEPAAAPAAPAEARTIDSSLDVRSATAKGFGGDVHVEIGLDADGKIADIVIGDDKFAETPGLGAKAQEPEFYEQFIGQTGPFTLGENVDAIASATITSTAVVDAVNEALAGTDEQAQAPAEETAQPAAEVAATVSATKKGFGGDVYVELGLDAEGKIAEITIGDDKFAETPGLGARAQEDEFKNQFIGKSGKLELGTDIDAIAGATITSQAVVDAVNEALASAAPAEEAAPAEAAEPVAEASELTTVSATKKGFGGDVYVELGLDAEGKIAEITIGDDKFAETPGLGARAQEDEFKNQFIGQTGPFTLGENVDAIASATITSQAVVDAVNEALASAAPAEEAAPAEAAEPVAEASELTKVSATKKGFGGDVYVELGLDAEGKIAEITIGDDKFAETPGLGARAQEDEFKNQFIGQTGPFTLGENVDAIASATITSQAVVDAVNEALASAAPAEEAAPAEAAEPVAEASELTKVSATKKGFGGDVYVELGLDAEGKIAEITIGDDKFAETPGLGARAQEDEFKNQFIGQTGPFTLGENVDAIASATITSQAVVDAVNEALASKN